MAYVNPGREDNIYIGKLDKERKYLTRQYLLWSLNDLLEILNGTNYLIEDPDSQKFVLTSVLHTSTQIKKERHGLSVLDYASSGITNTASMNINIFYELNL